MLYELVKKAKVNEEALEKIILLFEPKIKKSLLLTKYEERDDLSQELKLKITNYIRSYDVDSTPGFWEMKNQLSAKIKK
ncbi:helix-turn-helix domain-containing protein [Bacillus sp. SM2101]|uniref:helix-turn-helix domain-containing protein n=1 Tax=Bacillus sp. SM2101 TaxID=2805366 RepID=UPI001BDEFE95|nr:helix-turn-helix domain-containing protein [Bacillus sp. SM2101]